MKYRCPSGSTYCQIFTIEGSSAELSRAVVNNDGFLSGYQVKQLVTPDTARVTCECGRTGTLAEFTKTKAPVPVGVGQLVGP